MPYRFHCQVGKLVMHIRCTSYNVFLPGRKDHKTHAWRQIMLKHKANPTTASLPCRQARDIIPSWLQSLRQNVTGFLYIREWATLTWDCNNKIFKKNVHQYRAVHLPSVFLDISLRLFWLHQHVLGHSVLHGLPIPTKHEITIKLSLNFMT